MAGWHPHGLQPTRLLHPWDFPGKSTGVGCHCCAGSSLQHGLSLLVVSRGYSLVAACRLLIAVSSLVELRLWVWASFRSCGGAQAWLPRHHLLSSWPRGGAVAKQGPRSDSQQRELKMKPDMQ